MNNTYTSKLHQRFVKYILGVKRNCSNLATLGELGELPLHAHAIMVYYGQMFNIIVDHRAMICVLNGLLRSNV